MTQFTVTLKTLMEIDQLPNDSVIKGVEYEKDDVYLYDDDDNCLEVPYIAFGATITLNDYRWEYKLSSSGDKVYFEINSNSPQQILIFKELVKRVVKGSLPKIQTFHLSNNVLSYNSTDKTFKCGCETICLVKAKKLIAFMNECISSVKPVNKKPLK